MSEAKTDALEGFNVLDYDAASEEVVIEVHPLVIKHSEEALGKKIVEIITDGPSVKSVTIVPRRVED